MVSRSASVLGVSVLLLCARLPMRAEPLATQTAFSAGQATAGQTTYEEYCIACHQADLGGQNEALPLKGEHFLRSWGHRTTRDLFAFISTEMPPGQAILSEAQYLGLVAYLLQSNGATAGSHPLTPTSAAPIQTLVPAVKPAGESEK